MVAGLRFRSAGHLLVLTALLLGLYLISMPRLITFEDAGLFQMVCHFNGIAHPPGYPLFTSLCSLTSKIPPLDPIISGNLLSAVFATVAACLVFSIVRSITSDLTAAYVASLGLGTSAVFWSQAIIIEVYSLNVCLFALLLLLAMRYVETSRTATLYWGSFIYGLALSNHWPLIVLATPGLLVILWQVKVGLLRALSRVETWIGLLAALLLGLTPYLGILLKHDPFISLYGPVENFPELVRYVARSAYGDGMSGADWTDKLNYLGWLLGEIARQFGWVAGLVIVAGLIISAKSLSRWMNTGLWLIFVSGTFVLMLLVNFEYYYLYRAVFRVYPIISYMVMAIWLGIAVKGIVDAVTQRWPSLDRPLVKASFGVMLVLSILATNFKGNLRSDERFADDYGRLVLGNLASGANLFVNGDNETGPIGYLHHVVGLRPDIGLYSRENVVFDNALAPALASRNKQNALLKDFLDTTDAVSYFLSPVLDLKGIDYGLFIAVPPGKTTLVRKEYAFIDQIDGFLNKLLSDYEEHRIIDPHSLSFAHTLLLRFSRQYIGYAFERDPGVTLGDDFLKTMHRLQQTFPGKLVTLSQILNQDQPGVSKLFMAELVVEGLKSIPDEVSLRNHSLFYEYAGHVALIDSVELPADKQLAIDFLERSLELYQYPENNSICMLSTLYDPAADHEKLASLEEKFSQIDVDCQHPSTKRQL